MFWGLTPALNFLDFCDTKSHKSLNILVIGGADCRHVLLTCARRYRLQNNIELNFILMEACMETVAKQLLLLKIALQPQELLGLEQKTKTFMELYGNTLVRPSVAKYLSSSAMQLVKMVTNYEYLNEVMPNVKLTVKYKERDYLENLLKFWCGKDEFNIADAWDRRLRKYLGVRYDSKMGAFDWDLNMRLHNVGANQICNQEYKTFRLNGTAFSWLESEVSKPNRSLVCATMPNGERFLHYGYLGDILTGPFIAYGLDCEDKSFLKSTNGQNSFRATDVTERNLKQIFYELENQNEYSHNSTNDYKLGSAVIKQDKIVCDMKAIDLPPSKSQIAEKCFYLDNVQIEILSLSQWDLMKHKEKFRNYFNVIYFGAGYLKYFDKETIEIVIQNDGLVLIENQRYVVNNRKEQLEEIGKDIRDRIEGLKCKEFKKFNVQKDDFALFTITK